jgi:hypothetical protein
MAAPQFAEGNWHVFHEVLGMDAAAIQRLYDEGATADAPDEMVIIFA